MRLRETARRLDRDRGGLARAGLRGPRWLISAARLAGPGHAAAELTDLVLRETARRLDRDRGGLVRADLDRADLEDAIGVHRERDLDLRTPARRGCEIAKHEPAEPAVARCGFVLALIDLDRDEGLVVLGRREHLLGAGRDARVRRDHDG